MKPWAKILAFLILALGSLEVLWVVAAQRYLQSQAFHDLLHKDGLTIGYEKASSLWPGHLSVKALTVEGSGLRLELPEAELNLSLLGLAGKRIIIWSAVGQGGSLAYHPSGDAAAHEGPPGRATPPPADGTEPGGNWPVHFHKLAFHHLQSLTLGAVTAKGSLDVAAELHLAGEDQLQVQNGRLRLRGVEAFWKDQTMARIDQLQGRFELDPFRPQDDLVRKLSFDLQGDASLAEGKVLQNFVLDAPWLRIRGLNLQSSGRIVLRQGQLMAPTALKFQSETMQLELWKETVVGHGKLEMTVEKDLRLKLHIPAFTVDHRSKGKVDVRGRDLSLKLVTEDRDLLSRDRPWQAALDLPESTISNLRYFNHFLPQGLGFEFQAGAGTVQLHLDSATTRGNFIRIEAPSTTFAYEKKIFHGRMKQELNIAAIDFVQEGFTVPTGELSLQVKPGGADSKEPEWSGQLSLRQGRVEITPARFEGLLKVKAADLRPLLWMFDPNSKLPDWSRKLFHKDQLDAQFHLKADENSYAMDQFVAETQDLKLEAWYQGSQDKRRGKLLLHYGALSAGIAVQDDTFKVQLLSSRQWFQNRQ